MTEKTTSPTSPGPTSPGPTSPGPTSPGPTSPGQTSPNTEPRTAPVKGEAAPAWLAAAPVVFLVLWSSGFTFAKIGLAAADPMTFLALRYALVLVVLAPFVAVLRPPWPRGRRAWGGLIVVGALIQALYFGLSYMALQTPVSAGAVALIVSLQPILVGLAAPFTVGERVGRRRWIGLGLGLAGAALVIAARGAIDMASILGMGFAVAALVAITAGTLCEKRFGLSEHPVTAATVQYAVGLAMVLPAALVLEPMRVDWSWPLVGALAYLAIGNSLISISLLLAMIRHGEVSRVSALFFLVPPMAAVVAWVGLGEALAPLGWAGMALAAFGVAIATRPVRAPA